MIINMTLARKILARLQDGQFHSGESLGKSFGVTRAAIWKGIKNLESEGYAINIIRGRGYQLRQNADLLNVDAILHQLHFAPRSHISQLTLLDSIDSTNQFLRQTEHQYHGHFCLAEQQTAGRGRLGRTWVSPHGANIYLSGNWVFDGGITKLAGLSLVIGLAVIRALASLGYDHLKLKWPNDIYAQDKKLGGILIEMTGDPLGPCHAIIGLGLNVKMTESEAEEITRPWTNLQSLNSNLPSRNTIASHLLSHLIAILIEFDQAGLAAFQNEWREHDMLYNQSISFQHSANTITGTARGISPEGHLLVEYQNGVAAFTSGEACLIKLQ